jgi:2-oxoglutarate dehydrogenase E2 component (dihydrolipoamide succinyltransferase)
VKEKAASEPKEPSPTNQATSPSPESPKIDELKSKDESTPAAPQVKKSEPKKESIPKQSESKSGVPVFGNREERRVCALEYRT